MKKISESSCNSRWFVLYLPKVKALSRKDKKMIFFWVLGFIIYGLGATLGYMTMQTYRKKEPLTKLVVLKSAAKVIFWPLYLTHIIVIKGIFKVIPLPLKAIQRVYRFWTGLPDE